MNFLEKYILNNDSAKFCNTSNGNPLIWAEDIGVGYLKSNGFEYADDYWEIYQRYEDGSIGERLTSFRTNFVSQYFLDFNKVCDVGIGSGQFVKYAHSRGYDINPHAKTWLEKNGSYADPYLQKFDVLTFWDVLEHFDDPAIILERTDNVFMSIPIHENLDACLTSKHLKPNEHIWHFTDRGVKFFMKYHGFKSICSSDGETVAGRELILTYYFNRI